MCPVPSGPEDERPFEKLVLLCSAKWKTVRVELAVWSACPHPLQYTRRAFSVHSYNNVHKSKTAREKFALFLAFHRDSRRLTAGRRTARSKHDARWDVQHFNRWCPKSCVYYPYHSAPIILLFYQQSRNEVRESVTCLKEVRQCQMKERRSLTQHAPSPGNS